MFARTLKTTFTAGLLATTLAFTAIPPTTATAGLSDEQVVGILGLLALGAVIHNNRDDNRSAEPVQQRPNGIDHNQGGNRNWQTLPAQCLTSVETRRGQDVRMFGQRCLTNNYRFTNRLPQNCQVSVRGERGAQRQGYEARCMRNAGFRTN